MRTDNRVDNFLLQTCGKLVDAPKNNGGGRGLRLPWQPAIKIAGCHFKGFSIILHHIQSTRWIKLVAWALPPRFHHSRRALGKSTASERENHLNFLPASESGLKPSYETKTAFWRNHWGLCGRWCEGLSTSAFKLICKSAREEWGGL